jgi:hypothetical protein
MHRGRPAPVGAPHLNGWEPAYTAMHEPCAGPQDTPTLRSPCQWHKGHGSQLRLNRQHLAAMTDVFRDGRLECRLIGGGEREQGKKPIWSKAVATS